MESLTLMAGLASVTERIDLYATVHPLLVHPAVAAKMLQTIDNISGGRAGVNIVTGWNKYEFSQMGMWPGDDYYAMRYDWWLDNPPAPENYVFVLAGEETSARSRRARIGGIAKGERIWASRFVGNKGYLVTFRNIDPLWTIDLSDPTNPAIAGDAPVPGVSTYIHPLANGHLLTIGFGGDDQGLDWVTSLNLFDVTDFGAPLRDAYLSLAPPAPADGWSYAYSEATYEHKAFQYWAPKKLLAIPLSSYRYVYDANYYYSSYEYFSRLQLISGGWGVEGPALRLSTPAYRKDQRPNSRCPPSGESSTSTSATGSATPHSTLQAHKFRSIWRYARGLCVPSLVASVTTSWRRRRCWGMGERHGQR